MPTYAYPNGVLFEVDREALIAAGIMLEEDSPDLGMCWNRGGDTHHAYEDPASIGSGQEIHMAHIGDFAQPERPEGYRLLDKDRLVSILNAFRGKIKLPVVTAEWGWAPSMNKKSGRGIILRNGFHRFHASIIYGYHQLPVLIEKREPPSAPSSSAPKYVPPHLRNKNF